MIAYLRGKVLLLQEQAVVLDVAGVGYLVYCSRRTLDKLPPAGQEASLMIETHVREDHIHLYGFADRAEHEWFLVLGKVQGVGSKVALAILSTIDPALLWQCIAAQDKAMITRADGVGPKLASRILNELKDKIPLLLQAGSAPATAGQSVGQTAGKSPADEALSALINLGYSRLDAYQALAVVQQAAGDTATTSDLIRLALKELAL